MRFITVKTAAIFLWMLLPLNLLAIDQRTIIERTDRLKNMSEVDRDHLNRNIQEYQKLTEPEKQRYRELHSQLAEDSAKSGGLASLLKTYFVWLQTLTPTQRDELAREPVASQKLILIRRFKEAQEHSHDSGDHQESNDVQGKRESQESMLPHEAHGGEPMLVAKPIPGRNALSQKNLKAVMKSLVDRLTPDELKTDYVDPKLPDYISIIHASVRSSGDNYREWPDENLQKEMISAISKDSMPFIKIAEDKRQAIVRLVLLGIYKQVLETVPKPTEDEKSTILESLAPEEKSRILGLPKQEMQWRLTHIYLNNKGGEGLKAANEVPLYRKQLSDLFGRLDVEIPPGFPRRPGGKQSRDRKNDAKR